MATIVRIRKVFSWIMFGFCGIHSVYAADTLKPVLSQVTAVKSPTQQTSPSYTFNTTEGGTIIYWSSCTSVSRVAVVGNNKINFAPLAEGIYSQCSLSVKDAAGNISLVLNIPSFTIDISAPVLSTIVAVPSQTNDTTPSYTFKSSEAGIIIYGGACQSTKTKAILGNNVVTFSVLPSGTYSNCSIKVKDAAGNISLVKAINTFTVNTTDTIKPVLALVSAVKTPSTDRTPSFTFSASEAGTIIYGGSCLATKTTAVVGNNTINLNALTVGTYNNCTIKVKDVVGNVSLALVINTFTIDLTQKPILAQIIAVPEVSVNNTPSYTFSSSAEGTIIYGGDCISSSTVAYLGANTVTFNALSVGIHSGCTIKVKDASNNVSLVLTVNTFTITLAPIIISVFPTLLIPGNEVAISGSYFTDASVTLNGSAITSKNQSANEIRFIVPNLPAGEYYLEVDFADGGTSIPVTVKSLLMANKISAGVKNNCALKANGTVLCWGNNEYGQLGDKSNVSSNFPVMVYGITKAIAISVGDKHSCAVLSSGVVTCWGLNNAGQLGNNSIINSNQPVLVSGILNAVQVSVGAQYSCARLSTGIIKCWGNNEDGQLGNNSTTASLLPVSVSGISTATYLSAGFYHTTCAVLANGTIQCWGYNNYGQLGNNSTVNSHHPVAVTGITTAVSVSTSYWHTCALLSGGVVKCWGWNYFGQLGNGGNAESPNPVTVSGISPVVAVSAGGYASCALLSGGGVKCWGYNYSGQLGNNSTINSNIPISVNGISTGMEISAGWTHGCAKLSSGSVKCWGYNRDGQLGNGVNTNSSVPVNVGL